MHRSRLYGLFIDTPEGDAPAAATFWSAALGVPARPVPGEEQFIQLAGAHPALTVDVQAVGAAPRYHVDIETDDVDAETARLLALGAVEIDRWLDCHILRAPGGQIARVLSAHAEKGNEA